MTDPRDRPSRPWWNRAVFEEVYLRSFADADGDGEGDLAGLRSRLPDLERLGVDALWITPWYPSPMADGGYDVADYGSIDPRFGTLDDARALLDDAHARGMRVIADLVPNHTSSEHAWFREAVASPPGSAARARYHFKPGRGPGGGEPPTNWESHFGGPAWTRTANADGSPGEWYLHLFAAEQPDLDWANPEVGREFESILRFWFDLGLDGFRIDVAQALAKDPAFPDTRAPIEETIALGPDAHPFVDRDDVHVIYRDWRAIAASYPGDRVLVGEVQGPRAAGLAKYVRPDELHAAFNFDFLKAAWDAAELRTTIDETFAALEPVGAVPTWVLSNHDEVRHLSRFGRTVTAIDRTPEGLRRPVDEALGRRRARAAILLMLALPGMAFLYQGEELGLPEVLDLPDEAIQDPMWRRTNGLLPGRDGCRVPLPWSGDAPPFGFGPPGTTPWLPQPRAWSALTAERQSGDPDSMLELYRAALRIRRSHPGLAADAFAWREREPGVLEFERDAGLRCTVNLSSARVELGPARRVALASLPLVGGRLPPDVAAWHEPAAGA